MHFNKISMAIIGLSSIAYAQSSAAKNVETFWIWIALFTLGIVGITILFITSQQTQKMQQLHQSMFDKQLEMEKNQNLLLTNMSENIHNIAKQALEKNSQLIDQRSKPLKNKDEILGSMLKIDF